MIYVAIFVVTIYLITLFAVKYKIKWPLVIACTIMICISGLRHGYIDTRAYRNGFISLDINKIFSLEYLKSEEKGKGFAILGAIIKVFTENSQAYLFILALITTAFMFWGIAKRVPNIELGIFLIITTGWFLDSMNGVRQCLVSAILFAFLPKYIENKKLLKYILIVLLMSTVHASALLFIPIYFIARVKPWSGKTWIILTVSTLFALFYNSGVGEFLADILEGSEYGKDYGQMLIEGSTSVNVIRVAVAAVPLILSFVTKNNKNKYTPIYTIAFNMSLINFVVWVFATKMLYFYRLVMYFTPYMILLICYEINELLNEKFRTIVYISAVALFFVFHLYTAYTFGDILFVGYLKY